MHQSVLLNEAMNLLDPEDGGVYVDGNLGMGGHTEKILDLSSPGGRVIGFDWDREAMEFARQRLAKFKDRIVFVSDNFTTIPAKLVELGFDSVDGILLDLGLSSYQLDKSSRGFSFQGSQALDMRMDAERGSTAADLINKASADELADIFFYFGEERQARRITEFIVERRRETKIETTDQLVAIVEAAIPRKYWPQKIHVATKVFQALRIAVNAELDNLESILKSAPEMLKNEAKLCVISFHSLEDRMVKRAFQASSSLRVVTKKPVTPSTQELVNNPRARSAKLRAACKVGTA
nr:16S rRNA (cytosine(1402)-N(4))-methyltransferase RsmH [Desulfobulbaceae bacterium]